MINLQLQTLHEFLPAHGKVVQIFLRQGLDNDVTLQSYMVEFAYEMKDAMDDSICTSWVCYQNTKWDNALPMDTPLIWHKDNDRYEIATKIQLNHLKALPYEKQEDCFYHKKIWYFTDGENAQIHSNDQENEIVGIIDSRVLDAQLVASYEDGQHRKLHRGGKQ